MLKASRENKGAGPFQSAFSPYQDNGGTAIGVCGKDYAIVAGDTRMSEGYSISSRFVTKVCKLTDQCVISSAGQQSERNTLHKVLQMKLTTYKHDHRKDMSCTAVAQLLSNTLYFKRFFPYYTFNIVGGLDSQGVGAVYGYDAVGSFERVPYVVTGSASALITSILDNQVGFKTQSGNKKDLTVDECVDLVKDCLTSAGERDIYTGDSAEICIITKDGVKIERFALKLD
eukprot:gb/GEZN01015604.1/.p1 GENE.gb/GEZN01015604.1/~~gb/GEZN01015604.1/.p1  ORF type:complete len:229 (-),score=28.74 gb/GEZN01015604.1/:145-831(-)